MPCDLESDSGSGVSLAVCHKLSGISTLPNSLRVGDMHATYTPEEAWYTLPIILQQCL